MRRVMGFAAALLFVAAPAAAQAASLKELLAAAEKGNVDRRISLEQRRRAAEELKAGWSALAPFITVQAGWTHNQYAAELAASPVTGGKALVITPEDQLDAIARIELPLIDTTRWFRAAAASQANEAAGFRDEAVLDGVRRQTASTYYSYVAALSLRAAAHRSLEAAQAQEKYQEARRSEGAATELEVLRARAEVQRNKQTLAESEALVANARQSLLTLTGLDVGEEAKLANDDLTPGDSLESLLANVDKLPSVQAAEKDAAAADRAATVARLGLVPTVSANFTERLTNATGFAGNSASFTTGIGLAWRLDAPTYYNGNAQEAAASVAHLAAERQRLLARDQIFTDRQRLITAIEKLTSARAQVESAERAAQMSRDRYEAGAVTQLDVVQAERDLFSAEVNHIQARTELASSRFALGISAGLPVSVE